DDHASVPIRIRAEAWDHSHVARAPGLQGIAMVSETSRDWVEGSVLERRYVPVGGRGVLPEGHAQAARVPDDPARSERRGTLQLAVPPQTGTSAIDVASRSCDPAQHRHVGF